MLDEIEFVSFFARWIMEEYAIGSRHVIWVNPFLLDVQAEVVAYDSVGEPIMRTLNTEDVLTLMPGEYSYPNEEDRETLDAVTRYFEDVYGEEL